MTVFIFEMSINNLLIFQSTNYNLISIYENHAQLFVLDKCAVYLDIKKHPS